jgi:hypothetical protein
VISSSVHSIAPLSSATGQAPQLRLNQRITAEILDLSETQVVLSIDGQPVIARLETPEQAARLAGNRQASFTIASLADGVVLLKLAGTGADDHDLSAVKTALPGEMLTRVLEQLGREVTPANLILARAMVGRLPLTPERLDQLLAFLDHLGAWGENEAATAVSILSAGVPLTQEVYQAITAPPDQAGKTLIDLLGLLKSTAQRVDLSSELEQALKDGIAVLEKGILNWSSDLTSQSLRACANLLGRSLENALQSLKPGQLVDEQPGALALARLANLSKECNEPVLAEKIQALLDQLHQSQVNNLRPAHVSGLGEWGSISFVLQNTPGVQPEFSAARLRIARKEDGLGSSIDPNSTRLVIEVEVSPGEAIAVDLALVNRQISAKITASTQTLQERSQDEIASLSESLLQMGYRLLDPQIILGPVDLRASLEPGHRTAPQSILQHVNLEV